MCPRTSLGAICSDLWLVVMSWSGLLVFGSMLATLYWDLKIYIPFTCSISQIIDQSFLFENVLLHARLRLKMQVL
jgi:hypothetical protein